MRNLIKILAMLAALVAAAPTADARVRAHFTSRGDDLPAAIMSTFAAAERRAAEGRDATIDIAVFSFTHFALADELMRIVVEQPTVRVRLILDLSQLSHGESHVGPWIEDLKERKWNDACLLRHPSYTSTQRAACRADLQAKYGAADLSNIEIKYKWYDGWVWSTSLDRPTLDHGKSLLMHRKLAIVNDDTLIAGSFNWSPQAATKNYENLIVVSGTSERTLVDAYIAEFEAMWTNTENFKPGAECRALRQVIWDRLYEENE